MIPFPLRDDTPRFRFPAVTLVIVVLNALVWFLELGYHAHVGGSRVLAATFDFGAIPSWVLGRQSEGLLSFPAIGGDVFLRQEVPWPATLLTSMFLHGGWMHIIGNMWFLWVFGDNIEDSMGRLRFALYYLLCGLLAAVAQVLAFPHSEVPMVGASGAVAGVLGGYALIHPHARVKCAWFLVVFFTTIEVPAYFLLGIWFISQFFIPQGSGIAWVAHVAGFLAGLGLIRHFLKRRPLRLQRFEGNGIG